MRETEGDRVFSLLSRAGGQIVCIFQVAEIVWGVDGLVDFLSTSSHPSYGTCLGCYQVVCGDRSLN